MMGCSSPEMLFNLMMVLRCALEPNDVDVIYFGGAYRF